ncbi:hypothetical protein [Nostoc sp.]|uniref:hypothetical protein n=1 Tax=Nostoc sp. TaxID=1180 RepID=UPI002FF7D906
MDYADNSCFYGLVFPCEDYRYHEIGILFAIGRTKFQYIAYIFDLTVGLPTLTTTALTGESFRRELNDPSLPGIDLPVPDINLPTTS